jgi:general secretion pathway protein G
MMKRNAFTMIELVFVIVVLGILAAVAVPRLAATRDDAQIAKGRSDVAAIRAAIVSERQSRLLKGESKYITKLGSSSNAFEGNVSGGMTPPFMMYPPKTGTGNGEWSTTNGTSYTYKVVNTDTTFTYNNATGSFDCSSGTYCDKLAK